MPEHPNCTWAPILGHQEPVSPTAQRCHSCPTRMSQVCWKSEPNRREPQKLGSECPHQASLVWDWALLNTEGCLARAGHCASAPPSDCVTKGSWATERMVLLCAQAGLKLMALLLPPERLGYMFNRTMLLFLFELFFCV